YRVPFEPPAARYRPSALVASVTGSSRAVSRVGRSLPFGFSFPVAASHRRTRLLSAATSVLPSGRNRTTCAFEVRPALGSSLFHWHTGFLSATLNTPISRVVPDSVTHRQSSMPRSRSQTQWSQFPPLIWCSHTTRLPSADHAARA